MFRAFTVFLISSIIILSCNPEQKQESNSASPAPIGDTDNSEQERPLPNTLIYRDTLLIDKKAAVFFQPDSLQIENRMRAAGEADFRAGMDDYLFYLNQSLDYLKSRGLPVVDSKGSKYLKFSMANNEVEIVKLDTVPDLWGVYLFHPGKRPYPSDMTTIEEEYKNYFSKESHTAPARFNQLYSLPWILKL